MMEKVIAIVVEKIKHGNIIIQHDGASPHTGFHNEFELSCLNERVTIIRQPAQSPDLNVNDLSFFNSLQKHANDLKADNHKLEDLYAAVKKAYDEYTTDTLERIHASKFEVYRQSLKAGGSNQYDIPHTGITTRQNRNEEVCDRYIPKELVQFALETIHKFDNNAGHCTDIDII